MSRSNVALHITLLHTDVVTDAAAQRELPLLLVHMEGHVADKLGIQIRLETAHMAAVVIRAVLALAGVGRDRTDDLLCVRADQFDGVDGQVLIEVGSALGCIRTQVTLVFPLLCVKRQVSGEGLLSSEHFATDRTGVELLV